MENNKEPLLYRWVKASERLPNTSDCVNGIIVKYKGHKYSAHYHQDNSQFDVSHARQTITFTKSRYDEIEWLEPYTPPVAPEAAPVKSAEEIIRERYPFYDPTINGKDVELCGEQVQKLMERYLEVNSSSTQ